MSDTLQKIVADNGLKLAFEPQIKFPENKDEIEAAMEAKGDLAFTVALEVLPKIELADISDVSLSKPVADVPDADVDAAVEAGLADADRDANVGSKGRGGDDGNGGNGRGKQNTFHVDSPVACSGWRRLPGGRWTTAGLARGVRSRLALRAG